MPHLFFPVFVVFIWIASDGWWVVPKKDAPSFDIIDDSNAVECVFPNSISLQFF